MSVIEAKLNDVKAKLESDKITVRKDGVKLLFALLDGQQALQLLDSQTARLWPDDLCRKTSSWPRLLRMLIDYTERELFLAAAGGGSGSRSRGGAGSRSGAVGSSAKASDAVHLLKRFVAAADDVQRSGRRGNLQLWVWRLWHHIAKVVSEDSGLLQSQSAADYLALLSRRLLPSPEYTRLLEPFCAHTLLTAFCSSLDSLVESQAASESAVAAVTSQAQTYLGIITSLLLVWPGDLLEEQRQSVQESLVKSAQWLAKIRDTSRLALSWFSCAVPLLAAGGLDGLGVLPPRLHAAVRPLMRLAWKGDRTPRLKEMLSRYSLLQLQLGALRSEADCSGVEGGCDNGVEALTESYDMAVNDVSCDVAKWEIDPEDGSIGPLSLVQLQLLAGLFFAMQQAHSAGRLRPEQLTHGSGVSGGDGRSATSAMVIPDSDDDDDAGRGGGGGRRYHAAQPPAKRRRQLPPLEWLLEQSASTPSRWAPVLAALLHHHGYHLPPAFHIAALQQVLACLRSLLPFTAGPVGGSDGATSGGSSAAAAAMLGPQDLATKQLGVLWCLRCLEVLAQQHVYSISLKHGSRFFGCGFSPSLAITGSGGGAAIASSWPAYSSFVPAMPSVTGSMSGRDALAIEAAAAAAWQDAANVLTERLAGRNLFVTPTHGLPNALQAEALWALAAVLQVRRQPTVTGGGGGDGVRPYLVRTRPGLLQTVVAVMQACLPTDGFETAAGDGIRASPSAVTPAATLTPAARSYVWQAAATAVVAALNATPAADIATAAACQAAAASCQPAVLRLAIPPPNELLHALLGATSGASYAVPYASRCAAASAGSGTTAPAPPLPLDLSPEEHPHPYTRLPRWCPSDSGTRAFCTNVLAVQRRAVDVMAWQEARERAFRYLKHGSAPETSSAASGVEVCAAGRRLMGHIAATALSRTRNIVLDMADSGSNEDDEIARLLGCAQLLLSATLHAYALLPTNGGADDVAAATPAASQPPEPPLSQLVGGSTGVSDPWVSPGQAWEVLTKAVAVAVRPVTGQGSGGGGGRGSGGGLGGSCGVTAAAAAGSAANAALRLSGTGGEVGALHTMLSRLLLGMKGLQDLVVRQAVPGASVRQTNQLHHSQGLSQPQPLSASLTTSVAAVEAALQRQVAALRRVANPAPAAGGCSGGGGAVAAGRWQADGGQPGEDEGDDDDFGGVTRRPVLRSRLAVGGGVGAGGSVAGATAGGGGPAAAVTQNVGTVITTQMLTGPGTAAAVMAAAAAGGSQRDQALAEALRAIELLEVFVPVYGSGVSQVVARTLSTLMERRTQQQATWDDRRRPPGTYRPGGGDNDEYMDIDDDVDEIEDLDDSTDGDGGGADGSGSAYGSRGGGGSSHRRSEQQQSPPPPEELMAALARLAVSAAIAVGMEGRGVGAVGPESPAAAAPLAATVRAALDVALTALGPEQGLLSLRYIRYDEPRPTTSGVPTYKVIGRQVSEYQMLVAAVQLRRLARHLGTTAATAPRASGSGGGPNGGGAANAAGLEKLLTAGGITVLRDAVHAVDEAFNANDFVPYSWQLRAVVASLTVEMLPLNTPRFSPGMPQYDMSDLVGSLRLLPCWQEPSYRARRTGATLTRILFRRFTAHDRLLEELDLPQLAGDAAERTAASLGGAAMPPTSKPAQSRSLMETSILSYVEILLLSPKLEVVVARRLLAHAALCRRDEALVAGCLRLAAARLGYGAAADYMVAIMRPLAWSWFTLYDMDTLLAAAPILVDGTAAADPWVGGGKTVADPRVIFLRRNLGSVLLPLVIGDLQPPAEIVASLLGTQLPALLSEHVPYIFGTLLLLQAAGQGRWLDEVARNRLVSNNMSVEADVDRQLSNRTYLFLANMLLDVVPDEDAAARPDGLTHGSGPSASGQELPALPTFSAETCCRAVLDIPGHPTLEENVASLWKSLLPPHSVAWAAAALHESLAGGGGGGEGPAAAAAAAPRHRAWRLAGLNALLRLLGPRAAEPATGRYLAHILLQQLSEPALQPVVCESLHRLLGTMGLPEVELLTHGSADAAPVVAAATATVSEADRQALLGELLPRMVSALAEAVEAATASETDPLPSPLSTFGLPSTSAAAAAAGPDPCLQSFADVTEYSPVTGLDERMAVVRAGRPAMVGLLLRVTLGSPPEVATGLATCRLLPELPELRAAVELQQRLRSQVSLPEQLAHLAEVVRKGARGGGGGLGPSARARLVAAVRADVDARWSELLVPEDEDKGGTGGELLPSAAATAWELAAAAAELDDVGLSELAARLLSAAGLRDPRAAAPPPGLTAEGSELPAHNKARFGSSGTSTQLAPWPPGSMSPAAAAAAGTVDARASTVQKANAARAPSAAAAAASGGGRRSSRRNSTAAAEAAAAAAAACTSNNGTKSTATVDGADNWLVSVLRLMAEQYLVSDDPMLIVECQSTAIQLLALPVGREALEGFGPHSHTHRQLRIYLQQQQQQQQQGGKDSEVAGTAGDGASGGTEEDAGLKVSEHLWQVPPAAAGGADVWLRRLTPALLDLVSDPALKLMHGLARLQSTVCEALFPALLQHLTTAGTLRDPTLLSRLARQIQQHVLLPPPPQQQQPHVYQLAPQQPQRQPPLNEGLQSHTGQVGAVAPRESDPWVGGDIRAVQIVLRSLEHLRQLHRRVVLERKPQGQHSSKSAVAGAGAGGGGSGRPEWELTVDRWDFVYGLEIDYLAVAKAAVRCCQPATAMLYVGHWAEKAAGPIRTAQWLQANQELAAEKAAAGQGKGTGRQGGSKQRGSSSPSPPPSSPAQETPKRTPFENATVQGGVHSALQVLPVFRPQPPKGTTDALCIALDAYGAIDDPDALYALPSTYMLIGNGCSGGRGSGGGAAATGGATAAAEAWASGGHPRGHQLSMCLFEHENLWPQALSGHDLELRPTAVAAAAAFPAQLYGTTGGNGHDTVTAAAGIVSALRNLGGDVTAHYFLAGFRSATATTASTSNAAAQLTELQFELSWRLNAWSPKPRGVTQSDVSQPTEVGFGASLGLACRSGFDSVSGVDDGVGGCSRGGGGDGFHEAVYRSLAALAAEDRARVESLISAASHAAVCRLGAKMGPSSGGVVQSYNGVGGGPISCLAQLRMLAALKDACLLLGLMEPTPAAVAAARGTMLLPGGGGCGGRVPWGGGTGGDPDQAKALEPLLALRCAALAAVGRPREQAAALATVVAAARRSNATAVGLVAVQELRTLLIRQPATEPWVVNMQCGSTAAWRLDEARLVRCRGQATLAAHMALALVSELEQQQQMAVLGSDGRGSSSSGGGGGGNGGGSSLQLATALSLAGAWCAEAQVDCGAFGGVMGLMGRAADIAVQALDEQHGIGAEPSTGSWESQAACKVLYRLASYADQRYREFVAVLQSAEHVKRMSVVAAKRREAEGISAKKDAATGQMKNYLDGLLRRVLTPVLADEEADAALRSAQAALRSTALANYGRCLCAGDRHDLAAVYRMCQMWLQPAEGEDVSASFAQATKDVPSYKWLPLVYQMASRLSSTPSAGGSGSGSGGGDTSSDVFQRVLQSLLLRLAVDHPYHVIFQLYALRNGNLDRAGKPQPATDAAGFVQVVDISKIKAAKSLLEQLLNQGGRTAVILKQAEKLIRMYIDLAAIPPPQEESPPPQPFPANLKRQVDGGAMDALPVVSSLIPVDPTAKYEGLPHLVSFDSTVSYAGGINKPKVIVANDSSGLRHKQLVKSGNDDLRQDAVMQQTFALINGLLARDAAAARRGLRIATYRVVPFSPPAGLLQWVEDTQPLNLYLLGKNYASGAHGRYMQPGEWTWIQCYTYIKTATESVRRGSTDANALLKAFEEVCRRFSPCLHHFLLEAFPRPAAWLAAQAAFTRSTAAASMAGYLLGLGDRHSGNILLHGATGEVVHIDLGIAFEQGRFLVTPELVPFRLTRDVVDGMGVNGVEGPFRRSCEETMRVLRSNAESLLTVLEVVLHDPLHKWSLTLAKARQKQPRDRGGRGQQQQQPQEQQQEDEEPAALLGNADAARAVLRVKQKLEGRMDAGGLGRTAAATSNTATRAGAGGGASSGGGGGRAAAASAAAATATAAAAGAATTGAAALAAAAAAAAADAGGAPLNVEGQVRALLAEAQDSHRLSRMYVGWSAWL